MPKETFEQHRAALAVERSVKPKTLREECSRYWKELQCSEYHFNRGACVYVYDCGCVSLEWFESL